MPRDPFGAAVDGVFSDKLPAIRVVGLSVVKVATGCGRANAAALMDGLHVVRHAIRIAG